MYLYLDYNFATEQLDVRKNYSSFCNFIIKVANSQFLNRSIYKNRTKILKKLSDNKIEIFSNGLTVTDGQTKVSRLMTKLIYDENILVSMIITKCCLQCKSSKNSIPYLFVMINVDMLESTGLSNLKKCIISENISKCKDCEEFIDEK